MAESDSSDVEVYSEELDVFERDLSPKTLAKKPKRQKAQNQRSKYYSFFTWVPSQNDPEIGKWKCNQKFCGKQYVTPVGGGTASLKNHLTRAHKELLTKSETAEDKNQPGIQNFFKGSESKASVSKSLTESGFREKLVRFIVCSNQPFTIVEECEFQEFVYYCSGGAEVYKLPCAKTSKKLVMDTYNIGKEELKNMLNQNEGKISFIIDCWTSSNQHPFQGVVCCFIDDNWTLRTIVVDLTLLEGSHTGQNIADAFDRVLKEFNLWNKFLSLTTDNASNMDTMFTVLDELAIKNDSDFASRNHRVRCLAHILNLCCKSMIKAAPVEDDDEDTEKEDELVEILVRKPKSEIERLVNKLRQGVISIRRSPQRRQVFKRFCDVSNVNYKMLLRDVDVRWNSTLNMIERAIEMKEPLDATLNSSANLRNKILSPDDWEKLKLLVILLQPFREATVLLSSQTVPTLSKTSAIYSVLFNHLEGYIEVPNTSRLSKNSNRELQNKHPEWLRKAAEMGWEKLSKYYPSSDGEVYIISTVMDPRCKFDFFKNANWKKEWIDAGKKVVSDVWKRKYKGQMIESPIESNNSEQTTSFFKNLYGNSAKKPDDDELSRYLSQKAVHPDLLHTDITGVDGALGWWKMHQAQFPNLAKMAKDYLGIPGTGVPVEQFFSGGVDLLSLKRQNMCPETITAGMCLRNWIKNKFKLGKVKMRSGIQCNVYPSIKSKPVRSVKLFLEGDHK